AERMEQQTLFHHVLPVEQLFTDLPAVPVTQLQAKRFCNGGGLALERLHPEIQFSGNCRVEDPAGVFLGLGAPNTEKGELAVVRLFAQEG
ncbi:MAG TPA: pseudouridine synthase, partial [Ruminococcaceae bacterium]|nr:pseudouridine synthase [Oscillospiraceae bacterium]